MFVNWNNSSKAVQIHTGIITWNGTGIFMNIQAHSCSWNIRKAGQFPIVILTELTLLQYWEENMPQAITQKTWTKDQS